MIAAIEKEKIIKNSFSGEKVLAIKNLYKAFGSNQVLIDFNLDVFQGESVVVLGKSGSGKSVLIKCIIGLLEPDNGTIECWEKI
jgi:phospholipid/cholesterol/gamma-HCH transport system ATP-binding protein